MGYVVVEQTVSGGEWLGQVIIANNSVRLQTSESRRMQLIKLEEGCLSVEYCHC